MRIVRMGAMAVAALVTLTVVVAVAYFGYSYYRYNRVAVTARECQGCAQPVKVNGFDLYHRELGAGNPGNPVLVLHGGPGHSSQSFQDSLDFLARTRRVILFDQRGSGFSQVVAPDGRGNAPGYTADAIVSDIEAIRVQVLGGGQVDLVGHSAGGALAQRYALAHPEAVGRLVLVASTAINNNMAPAWLWKWLGPGLYATELGFPPAQGTDAWFARATAAGDASRLYDPSRTDLLAGSGPNTFTTWLRVSQSLAGPDRADDLRGLPVPTLAIYGQVDDAYTGAANAYTICSMIPDCTTAEVARSGHWPFLENPAGFRAAVGDFLAGG